ncbi:MAG: LacI family DNA-binding transcriptional regulator, partial [Dehalococcoidia bacterium]
MSITLKDLAALAKVHPSTVSRVLNNHSGSRISATTRQRILELIKETQYRPNRIARSLKLRQTEVLGVIIPDIANPFFAILFRGIEDVARSHSFNVILCNTDDQPGQERAYLQVLAERQIDGLIIATARRHDATILRLAKQGQPFVLVNRRVEGLTDRYVVADDVTGARLITQHLVQAGYRRIAHIAGPPRIMTAHSRALGYRKGLEECGLEYNPLFLVKGDFTEEAGYRAMRELLDLDEPPQAVFAVNDMAAIGAMSAVKERGLSVPEDVALAGYND